jgi:hypothetical protein
MALTTWLPVTISSVGVILAFAAFAWQVHRARFNQSVDLLFKQENDFFGTAKKAQRVKAARDLLDGKILEAEPILDFFETMALLMRRGALDQEMVWHTFFYWIDHYFEAARDRIVQRQTEDDALVWKDLVGLVATLRKFQAKRQGGAPYRPPSAEQVTAFLEEELTEAT